MKPRFLLQLLAVVLASGVCRAGAQVISGDLVSANSEAERYLRVLQDVDLVAPYAWSVRQFGPRDLDQLAPRDSAHPWQSRLALPTPKAGPFQLLNPDAEIVYNSGFPYGFNDGPVWAGRGVTLVAQAGVSVQAGPFSAVIEPEFFRAENQSFALMPNGLTGRLQFADGVYPENIDQPQRFGNGAYQELDPGQSTLRVDYRGVAAGLSTANQFWGPAVDNPILLGNNAAGIPNAFVGTSTPVNIGFGHLAARLEYGRMNQSAYSVDSVDTHRFMSGLVGSMTFNAVPGLELGGGRLFEMAWPDGGPTLHDFLIPYRSSSLSVVNIQQIGVNGYGIWNQVASLFARWTFPKSGVEIYGEFGTNDHRAGLRDVALEPDHNAAYMVGLQRVWRRAGGELWAFRGEILNSRRSHLQLARPQAPFEIGTFVQQGFTESGQLLGSAGDPGGGASEIAVDRYYHGGRLTFSWNRTMRYEQLDSVGLPIATGADVMHALTVESLRFTRYGDLMTSLTAVRDFNRNFTGDATDVYVRVGMRAHW